MLEISIFTILLSLNIFLYFYFTTKNNVLLKQLQKDNELLAKWKHKISYLEEQIEERTRSINELNGQNSKYLLTFSKTEEFKTKILEINEKVRQQRDLANEQKELLTASNNELKEKLIALQEGLKLKIKQEVEKARADSIKRQRSILKGQATEHLAPYINSNYNPKDYKFMGDPIDYIIFDGMSDIQSKEDEINKIIFMDIKTGSSQLNRTQKAIKKAIQENKIEFTIYRPEKDIKTKTEEQESVQPDKRDNSKD